jgi:putative ABC transport system permease protein
MKIAKLLLRMASRNTFRNKRRTLLTMSILILGSSGLLIIGGFFTDLMDGFREVFIHGQTGHLQVNAKGFHERGVTDPYKYLMTDLAGVQRIVEQTPHVLFTVPHLSLSGIASSDKVTLGCLALGVDADRERRMGDFQTTQENTPAIQILEGQDLDGSKPDEVILGVGLLDSLGLKVGDHFSFVTSRPGGAMDGGSFLVRGSFTTFIKEFDDHAMKLNLSKAQAILGLPNQAQSLLVVLDQTDQTDGVLASLSSRIRDGKLPLEVIPWHQMADYYHQSRALLQKIYVVIQIILMVVFAFSISNTINMAILERTREFGTMLAIGSGRDKVFGLIMLEAAILGLLGAGAGLVVGSGLASLISSVGIELTPPQASHPYITHITLTPSLMIQTLVVASASAILGSLPPAIRVSRSKIVDALGFA